MNYFDTEHCFFDDEGLPHLKWLNCSSCGAKNQPDEQFLMTNDQGVPEALMARGFCQCGKGLFSAMGSPHFMADMLIDLQNESFGSDVDVRFTLKPDPLSSSIKKGFN